MPALYVSASQPHSGKTIFCFGLALALKDQGLKVGYFKPVQGKSAGDGIELAPLSAQAGSANVQRVENLHGL